MSVQVRPALEAILMVIDEPATPVDLATALDVPEPQVRGRVARACATSTRTPTTRVASNCARWAAVGASIRRPCLPTR